MSVTEVFWLVFWILVIIGGYFVPTIVAVIRKVPNMASVIVVNVFAGWTFVGWVVALAMAARSAPQPPHQVIVTRQDHP